MLLPVLSAGCATQAELRKVRQDQKQIRGLLADTQVAIDDLRRRVDVLRAEIEEKGGGTRGKNTAQLEGQLAALEARLSALEQGQPLPAGTEMPTSVPGAEVTPRPAETQADSAVAKEESELRSASVDDTYREAFQLVRNGEYAQAVPRFREFLRRNPKSEFADNAQYWIGECYYALKDYNQSILALNDVLTKYPKSEKVPAALLRQASAFADLGYKVDARLILQKLLSEHPASEEADKARQKLQALGD